MSKDLVGKNAQKKLPDCLNSSLKVFIIDAEDVFDISLTIFIFKGGLLCILV